MNNQDTSGRGQYRHLTAAALTVVLLSGVSIVTAQPAMAAQPAHICGSANLFIGVRGTSAPAGSSPSESGNGWQVGGMGDQISVLASHFKNTYPYNSDFPTYVESLNYPATLDQLASSAIGRSKLISELNWVATHCTKLMPNIILAGHSQGAMVISGVLAEPTMLNAKVRAAIRAVAVFGDPMHRNTMSYKVYNNSGNGLLYASTTQVATIEANWKYYGWEPGSTATSPGWHSLIRDYCLSGDAVCQSGTGSTAWDVHNAYSSIMYQVTPWIDGLLANTN